LFPFPKYDGARVAAATALRELARIKVTRGREIPPSVISSKSSRCERHSESHPFLHPENIYRVSK